MINTVEKKYKEAKELFVKEQFALAYPLLKELKQQYADNTISDHTYINDDVNYYYIVCQLKLKHQVAEKEARRYVDVVANEPRRQLMSYHLAKYYFLQDDFSNAINYYERTGLDNISNEEIADVKFEKAYCYFNLKNFDQAKPLFEEVTQLNDNKYFIPASNMKLFTTAAALQQLGAYFRIRTSIYDEGNGVLRVVGRGDPSFKNAQLTILSKQFQCNLALPKLKMVNIY
jgi:D-alanyl-D-alanine carboxypeptidase